jgi:hypothetical protein
MDSPAGRGPSTTGSRAIGAVPLASLGSIVERGSGARPICACLGEEKGAMSRSSRSEVLRIGQREPTGR